VLRCIRLSATALLSAAALAACGTTVPSGETATGPGAGLNNGEGSTGGTLVPGDNPTQPGGSPVIPGGTTALGGSTGTTNATADGSATTGTTSTTGVAVASGRPIRVGVASTDLGAIAAAFGQADKTSVPIEAAKKVIAHINKTGGIAGRKIEAVFAEGDSAADSNTNGQRVCSALTEDTKVDIVVNLGLLGELFPACLRQRGLAVVDVYGWYTDGVDMGRHPNWLVPFAMRLDRSSPALLRSAVQRGLLKRGDTLGVLREDCPWGPRIYSSSVAPVARELGLKVVEGTVKCVENLVGDLGPLTSDIQRETLRFNSSGVTHVMTLSVAEAFLVAQFTQNASKQRYFPKYLVTSNAYPYGNSQDDAIVSISPDARPNMSGIGMFPLLDVGDQARAANPAQAAAQSQCKKADPTMMQSQSEEGTGKWFQRNTFYGLCEVFYVTKALLEANGVRTSISDVLRGYESALNGSLASAVLSAGRFEVGRRLDGVGSVRPFGYDARAQRFAYTGSPFRVP
jgi:hypothetical protein